MGSDFPFNPSTPNASFIMDLLKLLKSAKNTPGQKIFSSHHLQVLQWKSSKKIIKNAWEELSSIPKTQNIPWCGKSWIHRQLAFRSVKRHYLLIASLASNWAHIVICIPKCTSCPWKESFLTRKLKQRDIQLLHFLLRKIDGECGTIQ